MPRGEGSMFDTVKNHEERILILEETDRQHAERLKTVEANYTNLENTILKSSQSQNDFFRDTLRSQFELLKSRDEIKDKDLQRSHEIILGNQAIKKSNVEKAWEFAGKLTVGGSILYLLLDRFVL